MSKERYIKYVICDIDDCILNTKHYQLEYLKKKYNLQNDIDNEIFITLDNDYAPYILFKRDVDEEIRRDIINDLKNFDVVEYILKKDLYDLDTLESTQTYLRLKSMLLKHNGGEAIKRIDPTVIEFISSSQITKYKKKFLTLLSLDLGLTSLRDIKFRQLSTFDRVTYVLQKAYELKDDYVFDIFLLDNHPGAVNTLNNIVDVNSNIFGKSIRAFNVSIYANI